MAVGADAASAYARTLRGPRRWPRVAYARLYGDSDLHSHVRWRAIRHAVVAAPELLDVACGDGTITMEIARRFPQTTIRGVDLSESGIARAEQLRRDAGLANVSFECGDVTDADLGAASAALLLDVLEHITEDEKLLAAVSEAIGPGGWIVVSTPTPNFPRYFGLGFHEFLGHVRDGYDAPTLTDLLEAAGFEVESVRYYTKFPASMCCAVYYRRLWRGRAGFALSPLLNAVSYLDLVWPFRRGASSILVVARKRPS